MQMCINKRVVAALAVVAVAAFVVAPRLVAAVAPLLLMAACPLSMLLFMNRMSRPEDRPGADTVRASEVLEIEEEVDRLQASLALRDERRSM